MGLLLISGVVSREVVVADTISTELLGPGDVLRPWALDGSPPMLQTTVALERAGGEPHGAAGPPRASALGRFPEVGAVIVDRLNDRAHRLATTQAISQVNRVDRRLLALFWHLAQRWGRVTSDGVVIGLTLSHRMLGQLVGARRPTVSVALGELAAGTSWCRRPDGTWLLKGEPAEPARRRCGADRPDPARDPRPADRRARPGGVD